MSNVEKVKVWDPAVRLFHWSLVLLFFVAYFTGEDEGSIHIYAGYTICGLVTFRIIWGFIGSRYARFSDFVYGPSAVKKYLESLIARNPTHYIGHNPAGGWMVILLLISISLISWSGLEVYGAEGHGPLAKSEIQLISVAHADSDHEGGDSEEEEFWEEIHEFISNFTLFLVFIHIAGVAASSHLHKENLPRAMVTGYKEISSENE